MAALHAQYAQALFEVSRGKSEAEQRVIVKRLFVLLAKRNELVLAPAIEQQVRALLEREQARTTVRVVSAATLTTREQKTLADIFTGTHHVFEQNPALLGGLSVQDGDTLYHASLRNTLGELRHALSK
jgi:F0F1-type ATP synthase delta subunit